VRVKNRDLIAAAMMSLIAWVPVTGAGPRNRGQEQKISEDRIFRLEKQVVVVDDFKANGYILDIGGGGEGIIGQLKGAQVVAIDLIKRELESAPPGPLKIVMDARDLKFLDRTFSTATVFFTFMYIQSSDHEKVFNEILRVLAPGGRALIWDVVFPKKKDPKKEFAMLPLTVHLPGKVVNTGYGVHWPDIGQGLPHYLDLAQKTGFKVIKQEENRGWFYLELQK
jgi:SAM-dependent methyltransferase